MLCISGEVNGLVKKRVNVMLDEEALNRAWKIVEKDPHFTSLSQLVNWLLLHAGVIDGWSRVAIGILELAKKFDMDPHRILEIYIESLHLSEEGKEVE